MKKFKLKQNKKKPFLFIGIACVVGVMLLFSGSFGIPYASFIQLIGVGFIVAALSVYSSSCVSGGVEVIIDDRPDELSEYPKLYINTTKGKHNITGKSAFLRFTQITSMEEGNRKELKKRRVYGGREYIYANFLPERVYVIKYEVYDVEYEVFCDFDSEVAKEIEKRIEEFSGLCENIEY